MAVLTVGSGMQFATVGAAVAASHDGDTLYVNAGTYLNDSATINTKISIVGVGGMVHFVADRPLANGKAFLVTNTDVTLDHVEFSGAAVYDKNGAGIRYQGGNLTITNSYFHDNQDGILAGADPNGTITIDSSEFAHNGAGDGRSHNIYVNEIETLTVTDSYLHDAVVGHELKSRAANTVVENDRIADFNGTASYSIDLPNGGMATIEHNIIQQGAHSKNPVIIRYAEEIAQPQWTDSQLLIADNTITNERSKPIGIMNDGNVQAEITGNRIFGLTDATIAAGSNAQTGNETLDSAPAIDTSHPWTASPWSQLIFGAAVVNVLDGSAGRDLFVGGSGSDTFVIRAGGNSDTIAAFDTSGGDDVVKLEGYGFTDFAGVTAAMSQDGTDAVLNLGHGETLTFQDKQTGDFSANDFVFSAATAPAAPSHYGPSLARPDAFDLPTTSGGVPNYVYGDAKNNLLRGTAGNDVFSGGGGADTMRGGAGDNSYKVDNARDIIAEKAGEGIDKVSTTLASYTLAANVENLTLSGSAAHKANGNALDNLIRAGHGNDTINGGGGNDIIKAADGAYLLTGGTGNDIFSFTSLNATSKITDFHVGQDLLDLTQIMAGGHYSGADPLADGVLSVVSDGHNGSMISVDPAHDGAMHAIADLQGVTPDMLIVGADILF